MMVIVRSLVVLLGMFSFTDGVRSMDLKDVSSFQSGTLPVILRSTSSYGDIVAFTITARGGVTLTDQAGALGLLIESLNKGTPSLSKEDIDRILTETGAVLSIEPRADSVDLSLKCLKKYLPTLLPVVSEMIRVPLLRSEEIELVRRQMVASLKMEQEHPDGILGLLSHKTFYQGHPYLNRASGYLESLSQIRREQLVELLPKIFNKSNVFFTVVGQLTQAETSQIIQTHFGSLPDGAASAPVTATINNDTSQIAFQTFDAPTTYFMARFKSPSLRDADYPALTLAIQVLDNRLFEEVRTKRGLTYSVSSSLGTTLSNSGLLYVSSTQLPEAVKIIFNEVKRIQSELISPEDLQNQTRKFIASWWLGREAPVSQARIFNYYEIQGLGWKESNRFIERIQKTTAEQVRAASQKYLKDFTVAVVGPQNVDIRDLIPGMIRFEGEAANPAQQVPTNTLQ